MNEYVTLVLAAVTDPDLEGSDARRIREKLARAGLLAVPSPVQARPDADAVARARRAAGRGTPLAEVVSRERS